MAHTRRNIILGLLGAGVLGGLAYISLRTDPVAVDLHTAQRGTLVATVNVDGETRVAELFEIAAPFDGVARRAPVAVGDPVVAGETLVALVEPATPALLDARTRLQSEAAVREAEAALHVAETERARAVETHAYANSQFERTKTLVDRGVASISRLEDAHQALAVAQAALDAADARIAQADGALDRARAGLVESSSSEADASCCEPIYAPADGVVLAIDTVSERPVRAGERLVSVGDPRDLEIVADVLSADAVGLPAGATALVERWGGAPLEARMVRIEPFARTQVSALGIEEQRVDVVFEFTSPPEARARLGHGFAVFLRIVELEEPDVLMVPLSATFRHEDGWAVFEVTEDRATLVPVELGARNTRFVAVHAGLSPGARVVEHPSETLSDGAVIVERTTF